MENVQTAERSRIKTGKNTLAKAAAQVSAAFIGFMLSSVSFDGRMFPFGTAFAGGADDKYLLSACIGTGAGALVFCEHEDALKYISCAVLLFFLRSSAFRNVKAGAKQRIYPALTFLCLLVSSLLLSLVFSPDLAGIILILCDAVIAGACSFFSRRMFVLFDSGTLAGVTSGDSAAFMLWCSLFLLSLERFSVGGFSPARLIACLCVILIAFCGKENSGVMAGVCAGAVFGLREGMEHLLFALPAGGLLCGLCAEYGKPASAAAFCAVYALALILKGDASAAVTSASECLAAALVFVLLPKRALRFISDLLLPFSRADSGRAAKNALELRITKSAGAVRDMAANVEAVCRMLSRTDRPDLHAIPQEVKEDVCEDCLKKDFCWKRTDAITLKAFGECADILENRGRLTPDALPERLGIVCREKNALCDSFNRLFCEYNARLTARGEIFEAKALAAAQFCCAADIMEDAAREALDCGEPDARLNAVIGGVFTSFGYEYSKLLVSGENEGRCVIELMCARVPRENDVNALLQRLNEKTGIRFMPPAVQNIKKEGTLMLFYEKTTLSVRCGKLSRTGDGEKVCGDSCELFSDGRGHYYAVLSDGMGTGTRAALDSVMTCSLFSRLMKAGFAVETAFSAVNSALAVKSADESLATLDILRLDLYTGEAEIYKAGGAFTAVYSSGRTGIVNKASMPLGILRDTRFERTETVLKKGDAVIMISDGAQSLGNGFFRDLFSSHRNADPDELCREVINAAVNASPSGRADDITAVCVKIV